MFYNDVKSVTSLSKIKRYVSTVDGWKQAVLDWDKVFYNFDDKTSEENAWIKQIKKLIDDNIPEEYKTGVHCLFEGVSFMGEDIYIFEGKLSTTMHAKHSECGKYKVLSVGLKKFYCDCCKKHVSFDELLFP